jgi:hypothetical protein
MNTQRTCGHSVTPGLPKLQKQLLHLSSVYQSSSGYYREALRPVIRTDRMEART